jgi:hypothetical protein
MAGQPSLLRRLRPFLWPASCVLLIAGFLAIIAQFYHPVYGFTSLLQFDASNEAGLLPEIRERPVFINHLSGGYDGLYYAQLACRPLLRDPALPAAMDNLGYRARRILASWTAWVLALGDSTRALDTYALLNPLCWLGLAGLLFAFFPPRSFHDFIAWAGLLFSAGSLASVRLALTDLPALLLLAGVMLAVQRGRFRGAVGLLAAAGLTRETSLVALPVLLRGSWRARLLQVVLVVTPLALWLVYIRIVVGAGNAGWSNLDWPGARFLEKWQVTLANFQHPEYALANWTTLLALLAITVQAAWLWVRPQWSSLWWRFGIGYAGLFLLLGTAVWEGYPGAATRVLLPLNLAFNALAPRTRAGLALLILGNLTVPAGLLQLTDLPNDGIELAATRTAEASVLVQTHTGWFGVERYRNEPFPNKSLAWSHGEAALAVRTKPVGVALTLDFRLRSLSPRTVEITQRGRSVWRGRLGLTWTAVSFACTDGPLGFHTDTPPDPEGTQPGARALAFCIDHVRLSDIRSTPVTNIAPSAR